MSEACKLCRGACCESLIFPIDGNQPAVVEFYSTRAHVIAYQGKAISAEIEVRCPKLLKSGKCSCYLTRPQACQTFTVGGLDCRLAVKFRRPADKAAAIFALLDAPLPKPE